MKFSSDTQLKLCTYIIKLSSNTRQADAGSCGTGRDAGFAEEAVHLRERRSRAPEDGERGDGVGASRGFRSR